MGLYASLQIMQNMEIYLKLSIMKNYQEKLNEWKLKLKIMVDTSKGMIFRT